MNPDLAGVDLDRRRIWTRSSEADGLMHANLSFVTDKQHSPGKNLRLNSFKENACKGIGLIHKFMGSLPDLRWTNEGVPSFRKFPSFARRRCRLLGRIMQWRALRDATGKKMWEVETSNATIRS